jgi:hypothetical protein
MGHFLLIQNVAVRVGVVNLNAEGRIFVVPLLGSGRAQL